MGMMRLAVTAQQKRLNCLAEYENRRSGQTPKDRLRTLARVEDCSTLAPYRGQFRCKVTTLCVPCSVIAEVKVAKVRLSAYAELERLGYVRAFLVTITARHHDGDDIHQHQRAVKAQTDAVLTSLSKRRVTIATDAASECEMKDNGLHYHQHVIAWIDPDSELSDDEIRDIALTARHRAVGKLLPRPDGLPWIEASSPNWIEPTNDVEHLARYFSKTVHALDKGSGGLFTLPAMVQHDIATLMAGERSMRFAGLLKLVSVEGYDVSKVVVVDMSGDYFEQPEAQDDGRSRLLAQRPIVQPLFEGAEEVQCKVSWFSLDILRTLHAEGLMDAMKPRPARALSHRVSAILWPVHRSPLDQLRQLREECIHAGLVQDGHLTDKGALAIGLVSESWPCAA